MCEELDEYLKFRSSEVKKILHDKASSKEERALEYIFEDVSINRIKQTIYDVKYIKRFYFKYFSEFELSELNQVKNEIEKIDNIIDNIIKLRKEKFYEMRLKKNLNIKDIKDCLYSDNIEYRKLYNQYYIFRRLEEKVKKYTLRIWKNELTDYKKYKKGKRFCLLVHSITYHGKVTKDNIGERPIISTSLITNRHIQVYRKKFGFIYDISINNLLLFGTGDCQSGADSGILSKINPIEYEKIDNKNYFTYFSFDASKTHTPKQLEEYLIKKSEQDEENKIYNEIVLKNTEDTRPCAIFFITYGDKYFNSDYEEAKKLAKEFNLEIVEINLSYYKNIKISKKEEKEILARLYEKCIIEVCATDERILSEKFFQTINLEKDYNKFLFLFKKICKCNNEEKFKKIIMYYIRLWIRRKHIINELKKIYKRLYNILNV